MMRKTLLLSFTLLLYFAMGLFITLKAQARPNVILVLTDDQGIGDLGCHGNPWLKTPNIDAFYEEAMRMTDFHVSPLCTPTRSAIMTGRYPINNGAWATFKGRDALSRNTKTMADMFRENGYKTALFGKWHLGDNYPVRPTDSGFDIAIHHLAGGIGELSDYWGNSYFDDVYYVNNEPQQFEGYCTDVWFDETMKYIDKNKDQPFFVYLPLNAPHDPLIVDEKYAAPYKHLEGKKIISADLYGMIANIDENFGKLTQFLEDKKLADNTILIFMSDNGSRFGYSKDGKLGYNKGYEGIKG
ncbi:MAG: sulfatase-like hydrolase/transferase, partial [Lutimonas sp.]